MNSLEDREFNDRLQASAQGLSPLVNLLKIAFGDHPAARFFSRGRQVDGNELIDRRLNLKKRAGLTMVPISRCPN